MEPLTTTTGAPLATQPAGIPPQHVIEFRAANVKRLRAFALSPNGESVFIGGRNAQGKSSLLDAIAMGIGGLKYKPTIPVRIGEKRAEIVVKTEDFIVERTFTAAGGDSLVVRNADGTKCAEPQTLLNAMHGKVAFDPCAFIRLDAEKQAEQLRLLVGLDFTQIDKEKSLTYEGRRLTNIDLKTAGMRLASLPPPVSIAADAPTFADTDNALTSWSPASADTSEEDAAIAAATTKDEELRRRAIEADQAKLRAEQARDTAASDKQRAALAAANAAEATARARAALAAAEQAERDAAADAQQHITRANEAANAAASAAERASAERAAWTSSHDTTEAHVAALREAAAAKVREVAISNTAARAALLARRDAASAADAQRKRNADYAAAEAAKRDLAAKADELTAKLADLARQKREMIASAKFPVPALAFDADTGEVLLNGLPFAQASSAEQLRASVAIAAAANPTLRIMIIHNGSLLDKESKQLLIKLAAEHDTQLWVESVGQDEFTSVIIEDGIAVSDEKGGAK